ncbi:type I-E CRISPR-associated protein Cas5/CasD [Rothia nasisuis]|uniref:type I-E CRISPR-associated protein Cas5/CasD n=2 Tax=Rothia nasisuis TaxID=2109647 RepID=UPI0030148F51
MDPAMSDSIYIRLAGPLQSWAGAAVTGNIVRTEEVPSPRSLRGLLAGAMGYKRDEVPEWLENIQFTVRQDRLSTIVDDFHTINPRTGEEKFRRRILQMQGASATSVKKPVFTPGDNGVTSIVNRTYLADTEFIVRITAEGRTEEIDQALRSPRFSTYLGRKAFPAVFPFYLGVGNSELLYQLPAIASKRGQEKARVTIHEFVQNQLMAPYTTEVSTVAHREAWLQDVGSQLKRRKTVLA